MIYPNDDLDRGDRILEYLNAFWSNYFKDREALGNIFKYMAQQEGQVSDNYQEAINSLSYTTVPVYHTERFQPYTFVGANMASNIKYDGSINFDGQCKFNQNTYTYRYAIDSAIYSIPMLCDKLVNPTLTWQDGIDYSVYNGHIYFVKNPLDQGLTLEDDGSLILYGIDVQIDKYDIYNMFGSALGLPKTSTETSQKLMKIYWELTKFGPTEDRLKTLLSVTTGIPISLEDETVTDLVDTDIHHLIMTDKNCYKLNINATPNVAINSSVSQGDWFSDSFTFIRNRNFTSSELAGITLDSRFFGGQFTYPLTFENKNVVLTVTKQDPTITRVEFAIRGYDLDVENFWITTRNKETATSNVAYCYDLRAVKVGPTPPSMLPATVNPCDSVFNRLLTNNVLVILMKSADVENYTYWKYFDVKKVTNPGSYIILVIKFTLIETNHPTITDTISGSAYICHLTDSVVGDYDTMTITSGSSYSP